MSEGNQANSESAGKPNNDLPAVVRPNASFFVQLFLLPALIVLGIISVMFLFGRITSERTVEEIVATLKSTRGDRWQAAHDLAQLLTEKSTHTKDIELAIVISKELDKALEVPQVEENYVQFLVGALGTFKLPTGVPALRKAAAAKYSAPIRRDALQALATLADRLEGKLEDPNVSYEVRSMLKDQDSDIRARAALVLGCMKDATAEKQLVESLDDPVPSVGFDAANALASIGSVACLGKLREMIDVEKLTQKLAKPDSPEKSIEPQVIDLIIPISALQSLKKIAGKLSANDVAPLMPFIQKLALSQNNDLRIAAVEALDLLNKQQSSRSDSKGKSS